MHRVAAVGFNNPRMPWSELERRLSDGRPRIIQIKGINMEAGFAPNVLYVTNQDKPGFIGVWDISDNGDVPPRGIIKGPASEMVWPAGVALNARDREVYTIDSVSNGMYSYYMPEFFRAKKPATKQ